MLRRRWLWGKTQPIETQPIKRSRLRHKKTDRHHLDVSGGGDGHVVVVGDDRDHGSGVWDHGKMMLTNLTASLQSNTCNFMFIFICPV